MPTIARHLPLARWTSGQIKQFWPDHPRMILCGVAEGPGSLPLRDDPADWMKVVLSACSDLLSDGIQQIYLILDDHPPIAKCHSVHLLETLPAMARELDATSFVTGGYGPLNRKKGDVVRWKNFHPEKLRLSEPWKLPLHPALWNLQRLHDILDHLVKTLPEKDHTPWAFERIGSSPDKGGVRKDWLASCWRVGALEMSSPEAIKLHDFRDRLVRFALSISSMDAFVFQGTSAREAVTSALSGLSHPRIGPYPCFWSGVMKKGHINSDYLFYQQFKNRPELDQGLRDCFPSS